jgi:hypothetical protein
MKVLGVELAPLNIPIERRKQTTAVLFFVFLFLQGLSLIGISLFIYLLFTDYYYFSLLYAIWYYFDMDRSHKGGRMVKWAKRWQIWKYFRDYFPINLIKTADLDPNKNYIMGVSPHGVMCFGIFCNFATEATGFSEKYPGLTSRLLTLNCQYYFPLHREFIMMSGACCASERNLKYILTNQGRCKEKGQVSFSTCVFF